MPGGIAATEHVFQAACERTGRLTALALPFGRRRKSGSAFARLARRERPDLIHLDSAFDRRALVRDACYALLGRWLGQPVFFKFHGSDPALVRTRSPFWRTLTRFVVGSAAGVGVLSTDRGAVVVDTMSFREMRPPSVTACDRNVPERSTRANIEAI